MHIHVCMKTIDVAPFKYLTKRYIRSYLTYLTRCVIRQFDIVMWLLLLVYW